RPCGSARGAARLIGDAVATTGHLAGMATNQKLVQADGHSRGRQYEGQQPPSDRSHGETGSQNDPCEGDSARSARSSGHALPALMASPAPNPTTKRPRSTPTSSCQKSREAFPSATTVLPIRNTARAPSRSARPPPFSRDGSSPSASLP